jgi:hypothetical protein
MFPSRRDSPTELIRSPLAMTRHALAMFVEDTTSVRVSGMAVRSQLANVLTTESSVVRNDRDVKPPTAPLPLLADARLRCGSACYQPTSPAR